MSLAIENSATRRYFRIFHFTRGKINKRQRGGNNLLQFHCSRSSSNENGADHWTVERRIVKTDIHGRLLVIMRPSDRNLRRHVTVSVQSSAIDIRYFWIRWRASGTCLRLPMAAHSSHEGDRRCLAPVDEPLSYGLDCRRRIRKHDSVVPQLRTKPIRGERSCKPASDWHKWNGSREQVNPTIPGFIVRRYHGPVFLLHSFVHGFGYF